MPLTSLPPEARPTTRARCLGSIAVASMFLLAIAPVEAQSRVSAAPTDVPSETSIVPFHAQAPVRAGSSPLDRAVTLELRDLTLDRALHEIDRQANLGLTYTQRVVPLERRVTVVAKDISAREALRRVLAGTGVTAEVTDAGTVILVRAPQPAPAAVPAAAAADTVKVTTVGGVVRGDSSGTPLVGAAVTLTPTAAGGTRALSQTREAGVYIFGEVRAGEYMLTARMVGYAPQSRRITVDSSALRADFVLQKREVQLEQVVVTATGERRRIELGNDITVIDVAKVMEERPVTSIADLLEGRVPGLAVQRTSGAPGDPSRLRIRGQGSVHRNNDPIVIVDGIRIYSEQSAERSANLANATRRAGNIQTEPGYSAPSPLDNIDPGSIEKIEVFKGPSAATLYGADAANGVIVITSKRGHAGPPRWSASVDRGISKIPGRFPQGMARWGHDPLTPGVPKFCGAFTPGCVTDSLVTFQALNDPELTFLDRGERTAVQLGVSGGSQGFSYSLSGSHSDEVGMVRVPQMEVARFEQRTGQAPPDWMQRPQSHQQWSLSSRITTDVGRRASVSLSSAISHGEQQRSSIERRLDDLTATYVDRASGRYYRALDGASANVADEPLINRFAERATDIRTSFRTGLKATWRARDWLTTSMDAGIDLADRDGEILLMRGMVVGSEVQHAVDTAGYVGVGRGRSLMRTLNGLATMNGGLPLGWDVQLSVGANYVGKSTADVAMRGQDLPTGSSSVAKAAEIVSVTQRAEDETTFGVFVEPVLKYKNRIFITSAVRLDGGSTYGSDASLQAFPKVSVSYVLSEEPIFPFKDQIGELRLRAAYGHAGVQPGPADRLRLYSDARAWENGSHWPGAMIQTLGNAELRPERSKEFEAGFDLRVLDDRVSISASGYRTTLVDALMSMPLPPSVYGHDVNILRNVGVVRNTGRELQLGAEPLRHDALSWSLTLNVNQNRNRMVELGPGVEPFNTSEEMRVQAGYPLGARWTKPILGYSDQNGDGVISVTEILVGDSSVYVGVADPDYTAALHTTFSLFRRALTVSAGLDYAHDLTQEKTGHLGILSPAYADPDTPLAEQAAIIARIHKASGRPNSTYWNHQTVSTLRFSSLSVTWQVPRTLAERAGARALSVALQGSNLGLRTGYRGIDPHVNGYSSGNRVTDTGVIPQPRRLGLRVSAQY